MNFLNWLKNFFRKRESLTEVKSELEEIEWQIKIEKQEQEIQKERKEDKIKLLEKRKRELQNKKETIEIKKTKNQFQDLVDNIEPNRDFIIKSQEDNLPQVKDYEDWVGYIFKGITFIFCKEGYGLFKDNFYKHKKYYNIIIDNGYLARQHKEQDFIQYFHKWFIDDEVRKFAEVNKCPIGEIHVHHIDLTTTNNKKENLKVMTIEEHKNLHFRLKARKKFIGTDKEFEEWYATKNK